MTRDHDLFKDANRAADIGAILGSKLYPDSGPKGRGKCPFCRRKGVDDAFAVDRVKKRFHCHRCQADGDAVDLEHALHGKSGETTVDAAKRILGNGPRVIAPMVAVQHQEPADSSSTDFARQIAREIWQSSIPAAGTPAETYLRARGIYGPVLDRALAVTRFCPAAYHHGPPRTRTNYPAWVFKTISEAGGTGGIQANYILADGSDKITPPPGPRGAKVMWGPQKRDGKLGAAVLDDLGNNHALIVAEGAITALSLACIYQARGLTCQVRAALSLDRLSGTMKSDGDRCVNPDMPVLGLHGYTFDRPADEPLIIGVDHDMSDLTVRVHGLDGTPCERVIDATTRARISGTLARMSWEARGAKSIKIMYPPRSQDWNDVLRGVSRV